MELIRNSHHQFRCTWEEYSNGPAILPSNSDRYPAITIRDPLGQIIQEGIGNRVSEREYVFEWFVPLDAMLTTAEQDRVWEVEWFIETITHQQLRQLFKFDVIDRIRPPIDERNYTQIALTGESERMVIRFDREQHEISVKLVRQIGGDIPPLYESNRVGGQDEPNLHMVIDEGQVAYWFDTPPLISTGQYMVVWRSREKMLSEVQIQLQYLRVPEKPFWRLLPSIRMFVDKVQKQLHLPQAYTDSDCYEYLLEGVNLINRYVPPTSWTLSNFPFTYGGLEVMLVQCASFWGLSAQFLSEVELGFDFSGQTVTLSYDHTAGYSEAIGRLLEDLNEHVTPVKKYLIRKGVGALGVRLMPGKYIESRVIPFRYGGGYMQNLQYLGLLSGGRGM